jgi:hypothetical protein
MRKLTYSPFIVSTQIGGGGSPVFTPVQLAVSLAVQPPSYSVNGVPTTVMAGTLYGGSSRGGNAQVYVQWDRPLTNQITLTTLRDFKTFQMDVGTSSGATDVINSLDFSTTNQRSPTECIVYGLIAGNTYWFQVRCVDSEGNVSANSVPFSATATVVTVPTYTAKTDNSAITTAGNYQLTANVTGPIAITASNVRLYGAGTATISHSGTSAGVTIASGLSNVVVDAVIFNPTATSTTAPNIQVLGNLGTGCKVSRCQIVRNTFQQRCIGVATGLEGTDLGGLRVYANTILSQSGGNSSTYAVIGQYLKNFRFYGNNVVKTNVGEAAFPANRTAVLGECTNFESYANAISITGGSQDYYIANYGGSPWFSHDNVITFTGCDNIKIYARDGGNLGTTILWERINIGVGGTNAECYVLRPRAPDPGTPILDGLYMGFCTLDYTNNTSGTYVSGFEPGDSSSGGVGAGYIQNVYLYHNTCVGVTTQTPLRYYPTGGGVGSIYTWSNVFGRQDGPSGGAIVQTWCTNNDTFLTGGVNNTQSAWQSFNDNFGPTGPGLIQVLGSWAGFNPALDTPSAPTNLRLVQ